MRLLYLFLIASVLSSCIKEDKKNINKTKVSSVSKVKKEASKDKSKFVLTEKNAMDFFLEYDKIHKENVIELDTDMGKIEITLFNETKFHRSNFLYLSKLNYFKSTQFYRVINNFIIQGGNSDNKKIWRKRKSIGKYLLPPDTRKGNKHHRGVISMPSSEINNPHKLASPYEFFIVQQKPGAYHLDKNYTAFGRVIRGIDVVDKINREPTDNRETPEKNIYIKVSIID